MLLYAFTGCDYTPSFSYHGKPAWSDVYKSDVAIKKVFEELCRDPDSLDMNKMNTIINFTLRIYGISSDILLDGRLELLQRPNNRTFRSLPPSPGEAIVQTPFRTDTTISLTGLVTLMS